MGTANVCLVLGCSKSKHPHQQPKQAIEVYDGVLFRVLKKQFRLFEINPDLKILILSAKHGLIEAETPISSYEQKMTAERANELRDEVTRMLIAATTGVEKTIFFLGKTYFLAVNEAVLPLDKFEFVAGGIGKKLKALKDVLSQQAKFYQGVAQ